MFMTTKTMKLKNESLAEVYYPLTDSYELLDEETGIYYNHHGQELRNPDEYDVYSEGYTPFGDE